MTKVCKICSQEITHSHHSSKCWNCSKQPRRLAIKENAIKSKGGKCLICDYDSCLEALAFHHKDPNLKSFQMSNAASRSVDSIREELRKCVLLCVRCHCELHAGVHSLEDYLYKEINSDFNIPDGRKVRYTGSKEQFSVSKEELEKLILQKPYTEIARDFGVTDSAIRKRALKLGITLRSKRGYWSK